MTCTDCKNKTDNKEQYSQDILAAFAERTVRRLWIALILLIVLLVGSNIGWLYYESRFEEIATITTQKVTQDVDSGNNTFVGGDMNGKTDSNDNNQNN